jgi:hypothetical protein
MMLTPFYLHRTPVLIAVGLLLSAGALIWRGRATPDPTKTALRRWYYALLVALVSIAAIYATYVPAMLYYEPLGPGLATHINVPIVASLAVAVFSVVMIAQAVGAHALGHLSPRLAVLPLLISVAWLAAIVVDGARNVRHDAKLWNVAASHDYHVLHVLTSVLPHPVGDATIYTFGEAGTAAPGLPVFFSSFELANAVKIAYGRGDISGYPVVVENDVANCRPNGVSVSVGSVPLNSPSPYGRSYFFDVPSRRFQRITGFAECQAALTVFHPGPYALGALKWSY